MDEPFQLRDSEIDALLRERERLRARITDLEHENVILRDAHRRRWGQFAL